MNIISPIEHSGDIHLVIKRLSCAIELLVEAIKGVSFRASQEQEGLFGITCSRLKHSFKPSVEGIIRPDDLDFARVSDAIKQCALLERAVHVLSYVESLGKPIERIYAYPVFGSAPRKGNKCDIRVELKEAATLVFVVSDITSASDTSQKELRDLLRLGVVSSLVPPSLNTLLPSNQESFMAVSREHYQFLMNPSRHFLKDGSIRYRLEAELMETFIIHVI